MLSVEAGYGAHIHKQFPACISQDNGEFFCFLEFPFCKFEERHGVSRMHKGAFHTFIQYSASNTFTRFPKSR